MWYTNIISAIEWDRGNRELNLAQAIVDLSKNIDSLPNNIQFLLDTFSYNEGNRPIKGDEYEEFLGYLLYEIERLESPVNPILVDVKNQVKYFMDQVNE